VFIYIALAAVLQSQISYLELERFKINTGIPLQDENKLVFNLAKMKFQTGWAVFSQRRLRITFLPSRFPHAANLPNKLHELLPPVPLLQTRYAYLKEKKRHICTFHFLQRKFLSKSLTVLFPPHCRPPMEDQHGLLFHQLSAPRLKARK